MKKVVVLTAIAWLGAGCALFAQENPYSTQINITGKESGPYSIRATVESKDQLQPMEDAGGAKHPYKMDHSRDISDDDFANIWSLMGGGGVITEEERNRIKAWIEATKKKSGFSQPTSTPTSTPVPSSGGHPAETAPIFDAPQESAPLDAEAAAADDERYRQLDAAIDKARKDLQNAQDWLSKATSDSDRQQAIRNIESTKQRLQDLTNSQP